LKGTAFRPRQFAGRILEGGHLLIWKSIHQLLPVFAYMERKRNTGKAT
jgi:hypothetical protein